MNTEPNSIPITLKITKKKKIKIRDGLSILILGIANGGRIFMKLNINNTICYENLFKFSYISVEEAFDFILKKIINFNYTYKYIDKDGILLFILYSDKPKEEKYSLALLLKNNSNKIIIKNEDIMKSIYDFNKKYKTFINESDIINLNNKNIGDNTLKDLSNIKLKAVILFLNNNKIKNISPLKSDNFKYIQKIYLANNKIFYLRHINKI